MTDATERHAVVVRGGWDGHVPVEATDSFLPFLTEHGYQVTVSESLDTYLDAELMARADLILQCWSMGDIGADQRAGLCDAVRAGTGFAGWHGGIVDAFRNDIEYAFMVGGQFVSHPGGFVDHTVDVVSGHEIVAGIGSIALHTEQYYVHHDPGLDVHATTTFAAHPDYPWIDGVTVPAVWTKTWGAGRVFCCTVGHKRDDLDTPEVRTIIERGLLWASR